jgi:hypothetical protein
VKKLILSVSIIACLSQPATAQDGCRKPVQPMCLTGWNTFEDDFAFASCRSDMDRYQSDVIRYSACLRAWAEETIEDARRKNDIVLTEHERAVDYWNCKASNPDNSCWFN